MGRPPVYPAPTKAHIVEQILTGATTTTQAAHDHKVSTTSIGKWKRQFLDAGRTALEHGATPVDAARVAQLEADNERLKTALREATVLIQVWKMSAQAHHYREPTAAQTLPTEPDDLADA